MVIQHVSARKGHNVEFKYILYISVHVLQSTHYNFPLISNYYMLDLVSNIINPITVLLPHMAWTLVVLPIVDVCFQEQ